MKIYSRKNTDLCDALDIHLVLPLLKKIQSDDEGNQSGFIFSFPTEMQIRRDDNLFFFYLAFMGFGFAVKSQNSW
jgi:hypothetical protein